MATALRGAINGELDRDARERQRVAQRNEFRGPLGGLDRGDPRHAQHVALALAPAVDQRQRRGLHQDPAADAGDTFGYILVADIDHVRLTGRVEVGKMRLHFRCRRPPGGTPDRSRRATGRRR